MKIVTLLPGSGDTFYCQNCVRDLSTARGLRALGADVTLAPMYLPVDPGPAAGVRSAPVFYGAVNVWLEQRFPGLGRRGRRFLRWLDARPVLRFAARRAGSTDAHGLGEMTASMLRGEDGRQAAELDRLVEWLRADGAPDVVHLSNALLLGLARRLRRDLGCAVVCSLQDEDVWMNAMPESEAAPVWALLADRARDAARFIAVSRAYAVRMASRLGLDADRIAVVHPGVEVPEPPAPIPGDPPVLGFFARLADGLGLEETVGAFLILRRDPRFTRLRLRAAGGSTARDRAFIDRQRRRVAEAGAAADADIDEAYVPDARAEFFRSVSVLAVPSRIEDGYGLNLLESIAAGVPVVQPDRGAFPEIVAMTGGGIVYAPQTPEALAGALAPLLAEPDRLRGIGRAGRESVRAQFTVAHAAARMLEEFRRAAQTR
ncbi:MAG: glycosyltransferase family 4 protein [Lentisphaerae bacterium]|nr:glycosyltransferase family 4 protein [Lentisphaerota bacterium]